MQSSKLARLIIGCVKHTLYSCDVFIDIMMIFHGILGYPIFRQTPDKTSWTPADCVVESELQNLSSIKMIMVNLTCIDLAHRTKWSWVLWLSVWGIPTHSFELDNRKTEKTAECVPQRRSFFSRWTFPGNSSRSFRKGRRTLAGWYWFGSMVGFFARRDGYIKMGKWWENDGKMVISD